jgi:superfamily II DNA helicase RecQ
MLSGHLPRLARLIQQDRLFRKRIIRVHVDEAHFIYTTGVELYGLPAFRPASAWGQLGEFRIKLGKSVAFQALSGTQPAHIKKTIINRLLFDEKNLCSIKLSSNRPNMGYATHTIIDFLVPDPYPDEFRFPKTLVFHDNLDECTAAAVYLNDRLPKPLRSKGLVKHYYGGMSKEYLTLVYDDFQQPDGACRILHATEGASTVIFSFLYIYLSHIWELGIRRIGY